MGTKLIIVNLVGFTLVLLVSAWLMIANAFGFNQARLPIRYWLNPNHVFAALKYRQSYPDCQATKELSVFNYPGSKEFVPIGPLKDTTSWLVARYQEDSWTIYSDSPEGIVPIITDIAFPSGSFITSLRPISDTLVYPECRAGRCSFNLYNLDTQTQSTRPAVLGDNPNSPDRISQAQFDPQDRLIVYATPGQGLSSRIVINFFGELIHSIDEHPGTTGELTFIGYHAREPWLIYTDASGWTYFYHAHDIALVKRQCS